MNLGEKNSQLVRIAAWVNLLFLLLCIVLVLFMGFDHSEAPLYFRKMAAFAIANMICWLVNVCLIVFLLPALRMKKQNKNAFFYFLSFVGNLFIVQLLSGFV